MRQSQISSSSALLRVVRVALFVLGIALVDLSAVWAQSPLAPPAAPAASGRFGHVAACAAAPNGGAAAFAKDRGCPASRITLSHCFTSDCRPGASLLATSRPDSALSRFAAKGEADALSPGDLHLHRITPLALVPPLPQDRQERVSSDLPPRPARKAGADRSVPRPPPA